MGESKIAGTWRAAQGCAPRREVIRSLGLGSALCNTETQIECSCKSKAGVCQGATDPALPPLALPALGCQLSHRTSLLLCCQTTPVLGGIEGRSLLLHSSSSQHGFAGKSWAQQGALREQTANGRLFLHEHSCSSLLRKYSLGLLQTAQGPMPISWTTSASERWGNVCLLCGACKTPVLALGNATHGLVAGQELHLQI